MDHDMESNMENTKARPVPDQNRHHIDSSMAVFVSEPRVLWACCAALALLTSRYLLVELNIHYPLHLCLAQLATTEAILLLSYLQRPVPGVVHPSGHPSWLTFVSFAGLAVLMALSLASTLQAVVHLQNMPTLAMLITISLLAERIVSLVTGCLSRTRAEALLTLGLALSCAAILFGEYRLMVPALLSSIPGMLLAGFSRALVSISTDRLSAIAFRGWQNHLLCCIGFVVVGVWACNVEQTKAFFDALQPQHIPLLLANVFATAGALILGNSTTLPSFSGRAQPNEQQTIDDIVSVAAITAAVGCVSSMLPQRSYSSSLQLIAFVVALGCAGGKPLLDLLLSGRWNDYREYEALQLSTLDGSEETESYGVNIVRASREHRQKMRIKNWGITMLIACTWMAFFIFNCSEVIILGRPVASRPNMDTDYQPAIETEIVVSMYKEPIAEVSNMLSLLKDMPHLREAKIHIYVKDSEADTSKIIEQTGANNVTILPNIGRESETYLSHILLNWDNLARSTIFLQADVHNPREFYPRVRDFYVPETGMLSLGWSGQVCDCNDCGDKWSFHDSTAFMPELHGLVSPSTATCDNVLLTYKGQFAVSAKRIRGVDRAVYEYLQNLFADENSWAHQEPFLDGREDSLNAPVFGYVMERAWNVLFQCSDMDVAWKCPTLLSGSRIGGSVADCQCLDAP